MGKDEKAGRERCPACNGSGYVDASTGESAEPGPRKRRFFPGGYIRAMRLR